MTKANEPAFLLADRNYLNREKEADHEDNAAYFLLQEPNLFIQ